MSIRTAARAGIFPNKSMRIESVRNLILIAALATALAGCADSMSDITVSVPTHVPAAGGAALSQASPQNVQVQPFSARRGTGVLPGRIGERKTVGDISMGYVAVTPLPEALVPK